MKTWRSAIRCSVGTSALMLRGRLSLRREAGEHLFTACFTRYDQCPGAADGRRLTTFCIVSASALWIAEGFEAVRFRLPSAIEISHAQKLIVFHMLLE